MLRAAETRDDHVWRRTAQLAVWLLAPWSKKRLRVENLLKRRPKQTRLIPGDLLDARQPPVEPDVTEKPTHVRRRYPARPRRGESDRA